MQYPDQRNGGFPSGNYNVAPPTSGNYGQEPYYSGHHVVPPEYNQSEDLGDEDFENMEEIEKVGL